MSIAENEREGVISVRDFGPGVPETAITRIFDPFFRVEDARDANSGGTGTGVVDRQARSASASRNDHG